MKTSAVIEQVTKKPLPPYVKQVLIEVIVSDADGEDVEVCVTILSSLHSQTRNRCRVWWYDCRPSVQIVVESKN
jgi:hypothetical protein